MNTKTINNTQVETKDGWLISTRYTPYSDMVQVWIAKRNGADIDVYHFNNNGEMKAEKLKEGVEPEPAMKLLSWIWDGFRQSINGVEEIPEKQALDAELTATKYHLEDMRKLVFSEKGEK